MIKMGSLPAKAIRFAPPAARAAVRKRAALRLAAASLALPAEANGCCQAGVKPRQVAGAVLLHVAVMTLWLVGITALSLVAAGRLRARGASLGEEATVRLRSVRAISGTVRHLQNACETHRAWRRASVKAEGIAAGRRLPPLPLMIHEAGRLRPEGVWLKRLDVDGATLKISGVALAEDAVNAYLERMAESHYVDYVTLGALRRAGDGVTPWFEFKIVGRVATE
jgi:Tfp pilus assembly protein PilN